MSIDIKSKLESLPSSPGVYKMKNAEGEIIYIGKATSLQDRVSSYFSGPHDNRIEQMVGEIADIDYEVTPTVIEALILEANLIGKYQPKYNIKLKDNKSFLYLGITKEAFPRLILLRGAELQTKKNKTSPNPSLLRRGGSTSLPLTKGETEGVKRFFGPYTSASSLRAALDIIRKIFPYRSCETLPKRPCLYYQIGRCPAPCVGKISKQEYNYAIRQIILFFEGKKNKIIKNLETKMKRLAEEEKFEEANQIKKQIFALEHIRDVAVISRDDANIPPAPFTKGERNNNTFVGERKGHHESVNWINVFGRIEGYDISNTSGEEAVGSMVVFEDGKPKKSDYRKFKIKTIEGSNDVGMLKEVLSRRFSHLAAKTDAPLIKGGRGDLWPQPDLILIDGGRGQVNAAEEILKGYKLNIPVVGIAKGIDRKKDEFILEKFSSRTPELERITANYANILKQVRNEAHRFAITFHRLRLKKKFLR
jgi:excinuclease ABC subunit C